MTSLFLSLAALLFSCNGETKNTAQATQPTVKQQPGEGLFAEMVTNKGTILLQLEYQKTPVTVANFVSLAEGTNTAVSEQYRGKKYYDGLIFHRVIANFMIQGGDPNGNGTGGPGYKFKNESDPTLKHSGPGILAMANAGPNTNGSQFYITHNAQPSLDAGYTVFGHVVNGQEVVNSIVIGDKIQTVKIIRKGADAQAFDAPKVFQAYFEGIAAEKKLAAEKTEKAKAASVKKFADLKKTAKKSQSGLQYVFITKTKNAKPKLDTTVYIEYAGYLADGMLFDTSSAQIARDYGKYNPQQDAGGGYKPFPYKMGDPRMIAGFLEALNMMSVGDKMVLFIPGHLGYGESGNPAAGIKSNADLVFEVEMKATQQ